jgi:hypothetical protein
MDHLQTRLEALEQRTHTVERQLRWWRGLAGGLLVLAGLTWALPAGTAQKDPPEGGEKGLAHRVAALESLLKHFTRVGDEVFITGANLRIVNGLDATETTNGLGNLIVGYNEPRGANCNPEVMNCQNTRTGSHNVVVGRFHNFSRFGGLVVGNFNEISGDFASVSGGAFNGASGVAASVSGGAFNGASGVAASVSGGAFNGASGLLSSVSGGRGITQETEFGWAVGSEGDEVFVGNFRSP